MNGHVYRLPYLQNFNRHFDGSLPAAVLRPPAHSRLRGDSGEPARGRHRGDNGEREHVSSVAGSNDTSGDADWF